MPLPDLGVLRELLARHQAQAGQLRRLCTHADLVPDEARLLIASLDASALELSAAILYVQTGIASNWRRATAQLRAALPSSLEVDHGVPVERFTVSGDRPSEHARGDRPALSGAWNPGGHHPRP